MCDHRRYFRLREFDDQTWEAKRPPGPERGDVREQPEQGVSGGGAGGGDAEDVAQVEGATATMAAGEEAGEQDQAAALPRSAPPVMGPHHRWSRVGWATEAVYRRERIGTAVA